MAKPSNEKVIMTGPATLNDKTNVRMALHMTQDATARLSVIHIKPDKIANTDLPIICAFAAVACPEQSIRLFCHPNHDQNERIIMEQTATIPLILAVQILTKLMWLQVTSEATVFKMLVTFTYIQNRRPMAFKGRKH